MNEASQPPIDRLAPTRRPNEAPIGYQRWRTLLFLHWEVPVEKLRRVVPAELSLDLWEGRAYVGVVPFAMEGVRPWWSPERLAFSFLETNVRAYVHHRGRPGVYFFSLDVNSRIAVAAARHFWGLPYFNAQMSLTRSGNRIAYTTRRRSNGASLDVRYRLGQPLGSSQPDTLEHFLLERYLLFVERRGKLHVGQVHHAPYPAQAAAVDAVEQSLIQAAGLSPLTNQPAFVHYAAGVDVEIFPLRPAS